MAACEFDLEIKDTPEAFLERANTLAQKMKGSFEGNTQEGKFQIPTPFGGFSGVYSVSGGLAHISVTDKPILMGCGVIADILKSKLS